MKAKIYKIYVQDDPVHSYTRRKITECFVPEENIYFNYKYSWIDAPDRFDLLAEDIKEIKINRDFIDKMKTKIRLEEEVLNEQQELLDEHKE